MITMFKIGPSLISLALRIFCRSDGTLVTLAEKVREVGHTTVSVSCEQVIDG